MTSDPCQANAPRRSPPLGISGVTLLMLVTLVLTTSPAIGRGQQVGPAGFTPPEQSSERAIPGHRVVQRQGGDRQDANRHIRPSGGSAALSLASRVNGDSSCRLPATASNAPHGATAPERVPVMLLNLPPPRG